MTGQRFLDLDQIRDIPNFTKMVNTNGAHDAFFAALRDKFSICNHVKICWYTPREFSELVHFHYVCIQDFQIRCDKGVVWFSEPVVNKLGVVMSS